MFILFLIIYTSTKITIGFYEEETDFIRRCLLIAVSALRDVESAALSHSCRSVEPNRIKMIALAVKMAAQSRKAIRQRVSVCCDVDKL